MIFFAQYWKMIDVALPIWFAAMFIVPSVMERMNFPRWLLALVVWGGVSVGIFGWYKNLTVMVPSEIGNPVRVIVMIAVGISVAWQTVFSPVKQNAK